MSTNDQTPEATTTPEDAGKVMECARHAMVAAAHFAGAAMKAYSEAYPDQAALLAQSGGRFAVRVSDILSTNPRVALVNVVGGDEVEIAHVLLSQSAAPDPLAMH
ncbi:MAG: hypothetical protein WCV99_04235 [Sterolibacterium sp.]|jgi:hypothetical protein